MNFQATLQSLFLASFITQVVHADPLDTYRGVNRLILMFIPQDSSTEKIAAALATHRGEIEERELKIIDVSAEAHRISTALRLPPEQTHSLYIQLKLDSASKLPVFILIGKDGGEKARQTGTLDLHQWFVLIDGMPMRRREIQNHKRKTH